MSENKKKNENILMSYFEYIKDGLKKITKNSFPEDMKHRKLRIILTWFIVFALVTGLVVGTIGVNYILGVANDAPELNPDDFTAAQSSKIYDAQGNVIANIGLQIRENITYEDLPQSVIDAFVAIEDSRFFEHNGFDIPRFTKAIFENLKTRSFSQGGSTFTMQLVKGTYFETEEATAVRSGLAGVNRKLQEIKVALQAAKVISKKDILTYFLNKLNYGVSRICEGMQTHARLQITSMINNTNLSTMTSADDLWDGYELLRQVVDLTGIPVAYTTGKKDILDAFLARDPDPKYVGKPVAIDVYMHRDWDSYIEYGLNTKNPHKDMY